MCTTLDNLILERQCSERLCWAAVASGISTFYKDKPPLSQCKIASKQISDTQLAELDCCQGSNGEPCNPDCDREEDLEETLTLIQHLDGKSVKGLPSPTALATVLAKVQAGFPVCVRVEFKGKGGHFVAIQGFCNEDPNNIQVVICDPAGTTTTTLPLEAFKTAYLNTGTWSRTFFTK